MVVVRLVLSFGVALTFGWLGLWLMAAASYSERLPLAGFALLAGAPAWAMVTHGVLKRVPAKQFRSDPML